ncbi:MAG: hypothetical protein QW569_00715 [Candidatus Bathyarchaeia archaeon]
MKALALFSGGLDSTLAVMLVRDQGVDVEALKFTTPFCLCDRGGGCMASEASKRYGIPLKIMYLGGEYLRMVRRPRHGYGSALNPCIDCRILMLKKAKRYARGIGAEFIVTGEVLGQRPMSQRLETLKLIEREAGLEGRILRPLSAKLLPETEAEKKGWIDRRKLLDIRGRSRKRQMELAAKLGIRDYPSPAGGCLLTQREYAAKLRDLFQHRKRITMKDIQLLKVGRHFRYGENKIIVGRNEAENKLLLALKNRCDYVFEVPGHGSPITLLQGEKTREAITAAASLTARYSDAPGDMIIVKYGRERPSREITVTPISDPETWRIKWPKAT